MLNIMRDTSDLSGHPNQRTGCAVTIVDFPSDRDLEAVNKDPKRQAVGRVCMTGFLDCAVGRWSVLRSCGMGNMGEQYFLV